MKLAPLKKTLLLLGLFLIPLSIALFCFSDYGLKRLLGVYEIDTRANAKPGDVPFLNLPPSASDIGYWDDGYQRRASFAITEEEFLRVFPKVTFTEIVGESTYFVWEFGDPEYSPSGSGMGEPQATDSGLIYQETWDNGGGIWIVYDRNLKKAFFDYTRW